MNNEEPRKLSEYLRTDNGKAVLKKLNDETDALGEKPAKETGYRYSLLSEALYFFEEACADAKSGEEDFDMDVDEGLFEAEPEEVAGNVLGHIFWDDCNYDLLGEGDGRYSELEFIWRDYRA